MRGIAHQELQFHAARHEDIMFPVVERPMFWMDKHGASHACEHKMLLRADNEKNPVPLAVVGKEYKLVTNREIRAALEPVLAPYKVIERNYMDYHGKKCYLDFTFTDVVEMYSGHRVNFRAIFWNGYGGASFGVKVGAINFFCLNGMIHGEHEAHYRRHTGGLDVSVASEWIENGLTQHRVVTQKWRGWMQRVFPTNGRVEFDTTSIAWREMSENKQHIHAMDNTYTEKYVPVYGHNLFAIYQTLTDFASHNDNYKLRNVQNNAPAQKELELLSRAERVMARLAA